MIRNGWQVAIDLTDLEECNQNILNSPLFATEEEADAWYRSLDMTENEVRNLDFIMVHYEDDKIVDTYII